MKKLSLATASLLLFAIASFAQQTQQQAANTDKKATKKGEKKAMVNNHKKADTKNTDNKSTAPATK